MMMLRCERAETNEENLLEKRAVKRREKSIRQTKELLKNSLRRIYITLLNVVDRDATSDGRTQSVAERPTFWLYRRADERSSIRNNDNNNIRRR